MATAFYTPSNTGSSADVLALESSLADVKLTVSSATPLATAGSLVSRDGNAAAAFSQLTLTDAPTAATDAVNKAYADALTDGATAAATANTIMRRDGNAAAAVTQLTVSDAPQYATDAVNKAYVDAFTSGITYKEACDYKTVAPLPTYTHEGAGAMDPPYAVYTGFYNGALVVDGMAVAVGDRILLDQSISLPSDGGIFVVVDAGSAETKWVLSRAPDARFLKQGMVTYVLSGATALNSQYALLNENPMVGVTNQTWAKLSDAGATANVANALVRRGAAGEIAVGAITATSLALGPGSKKIVWGYDGAPGDIGRQDFQGVSSSAAGTTYNLLDGGQSHIFQAGNGSSAPKLLMDVSGGGTVTIPGNVSSNGNLALSNTTAATAVSASASPYLLLNGRIYSSGSSLNMGARIRLAAAVNNASQTVSKLSFEVGTDSTTPTERAYLTSDGDLTVNRDLYTAGWMYPAGVRSSSDVAIRDLTPATTALSRPSPNVHLIGTVYDSSSSSSKTVACTMNLIPTGNNTASIASRAAFKFDVGGAGTTEAASLSSTGQLTLTDGIRFPARGTDGVASLLNAYEEYDHTVTFRYNAATGLGPTVFKLTRVGRLVTLTSASSTLWTYVTGAASVFTSETPIPTRFRIPAGAVSTPIAVTMNSVWSWGHFSLDTAGVITISATAGGGNFTSGVTDGFGRVSTSWTV